MKKFVKILFSALLVLQVIVLAACGGGKEKVDPEKAVIDQYVGRWDCTKVVTADGSVDFEKLGSIIDMEMYIEFNEDKTYVVHYFTNGKEGSAYPQEGTFEVNVEQKVLTLTGDTEGTASLYQGTSLQLSINGGVTQYYKKHITQVESSENAAA